MVERQISRALGISESVADTSPAINLLKRESALTKEFVEREIEKFGRHPVVHQSKTGENGIARAIIEEVFEKNGIPNRDSSYICDLVEKQSIIDSLCNLYKNDDRFKDLKLWPATRDWLKKHLGEPDLIIPD